MTDIESFNKKYQAMAQLADEAFNEHWINQQLIDKLYSIEQQQAGDLFVEAGTRPLIVAFFGGTGTGKSSLLNRLAGESIAQTGIIRPTSLEVTLYLHKSVALADLPEELPVDLINISYHDNEERKLLAWLDMPDFDSTESANRKLVELWLPYIDWLVYVVSPERYQDDSGWQILLQRNHRHRWLFVMNHWDEGAEIQFKDFTDRLIATGINDPVVLRTSCAPGHAKTDDDFSQLEGTIQKAIQDYGLTLLKASGLNARINDLQSFADSFKSTMGSEHQWVQGKLAFDNVKNKRLDDLTNSIKATVNIVTSPAIEAESHSFTLFKKARQSLIDPLDLVNSSLSGRSLTMLEDLARELPLATKLRTAEALAASYEGFPTDGRQFLGAELEQGIIDALALPGTSVQRLMVKLSGLLSWLLPLLTASWAAFHLFSTYLKGTAETGQFLGFDFAVHSALLIGISWLIPFILHRRLLPSIAKTAKLGLHNGVNKAKTRLSDDLDNRFNQTQRRRQSFIDRITDISENNLAET